MLFEVSRATMVTMSLLEDLGVEYPIVQAGMGGGVSRHELAAAVSEAGGLGTIAVVGASAIRRELRSARERTARPVAVNVLLPVARKDWFEAASEAEVVVTFWGTPRRRTPRVWLHQCGSVAEARMAHRAGADGVILQGVEAGGHVRGVTPSHQLLEQVRTVLPVGYPLLLAGGIAEHSDVQRALEAGACAVVAGTRFLMTPESCAHPEYKRRLLTADETVLTELFGFGWPATHRVVPNAATQRQLTADGEVPALNLIINRASAPGARFTPMRWQWRLAQRQRPESRLLTPFSPVAELPASFVDAGPMYAGETVARIRDIRSAAQVVADLVGRST